MTRVQTERERARDRARYRRARAAGSCTHCGAEAFPGRTRCTPCGRVNAENDAKRRAAR